MLCFETYVATGITNLVLEWRSHVLFKNLMQMFGANESKGTKLFQLLSKLINIGDLCLLIMQVIYLIKRDDYYKWYKNAACLSLLIFFLTHSHAHTYLHNCNSCEMIVATWQKEEKILLTGRKYGQVAINILNTLLLSNIKI